MRFRNAVRHKESLSGFVIFRTGSEFLSLLLPRHIAHARIISDFFSKSLCLSVVLVHRRQKQEMEYVKLDVRVAILMYFKREAHRLARNQWWMTTMDRDSEVRDRHWSSSWFPSRQSKNNYKIKMYKLISEMGSNALDVTSEVRLLFIK